MRGLVRVGSNAVASISPEEVADVAF